MRKLLVAALFVIALLLAGAAPSAPPGYTVALDQTAPSFTDQVTFTVESSDAYPWVNLRCSQAGTLVYEQWHGYFASYYKPQVFTLGPTNLWQSGAADCVARLGYWKANGSFGVRVTAAFGVAG